MAFINRSSKIFKIVSLSIVLIIATVIMKVFVDSWHKIPFNELHINYYYLISSFILYIFLSACGVWLWKYILNLLGKKPEFLALWRVSAYAQMARYIPGKVWHYLGKVYWGMKIDLSKKIIILSSLLEIIFIMSSAFILSLFSVQLFLKNKYFSYNYLFFLTLIIIGVLVFVHPKILGKIINKFGKKFISNPVTLDFSYGQFIVVILLYTLLWIMAGFQVYLFIISFYNLPLIQCLPIAILHAGSWLIGFLSTITPSGLGVKEGIFIVGFKTIVPVTIAIMSAILIRLFQVSLDVLTAVIFFIFDKGAWQNLITFKKSSETDKDLQ